MKKTLFITFLILGIISFYLIPLPISARDVTETFRCYDSPQWHLPEGVKARIGKGSIIRLQYSPDGNVLAVMSSMGIWLYDAHSGEERALLSGHTGLILGMSFSPDSRIIASGGTDGTTRMWDIATGKQKHTLTVPRFRIGDVSFNSDGKTLASVSVSAMSKRFIGWADPYIQTIGIASTRSEIELWDVATGKHKETIETGDLRFNILFSPDGKTLASVYDKNISLWDVTTGKCKQILGGNTSRIRSMSFSLDSHTFASGSWQEIHVWDVAIDKQNEIVSIRHPRLTLKGHTSYVNNLSFSPDGQTLASGSEDKTIRLWDVATGKQKNTIRHSLNLSSISISPDGKTLASGIENGTVLLWDITTLKHKQTFKGHKRHVSSMSFSTDGKMLVSGSWDKSVRLWDVMTGKRKKTFRGRVSSVYSVSFSPDGKTFASADTNIRILDASTGKHKQTLNGNSDYVKSILFSPDGKTLASLEGSKDSIIRLWNVDTGTHRQSLQIKTSGVLFVA